MATKSTENSKSIMRSIRFPKDLLAEMDAVREEGESTAGFIVTACQAEVEYRRDEEGE